MDNRGQQHLLSKSSIALGEKAVMDNRRQQPRLTTSFSEMTFRGKPGQITTLEHSGKMR